MSETPLEAHRQARIEAADERRERARSFRAWVAGGPVPQWAAEEVEDQYDRITSGDESKPFRGWVEALLMAYGWGREDAIDDCAAWWGED